MRHREIALSIPVIKCRQRRPIMSHLLKCDVCGNKYTSNRSDSKTCSSKCRKAASRGGYKGARKFESDSIKEQPQKEYFCERCKCAYVWHQATFTGNLLFCKGKAICKNCNQKGWFFFVRDNIPTLGKRLSVAWYRKHKSFSELLEMQANDTYPYMVISGMGKNRWL